MSFYVEIVDEKKEKKKINSSKCIKNSFYYRTKKKWQRKRKKKRKRKLKKKEKIEKREKIKENPIKTKKKRRENQTFFQLNELN